MDLAELKEWFAELEDHLDERQNTIAKEVIKEIRYRLNFLLQVGLDYLNLNRPSRTLQEERRKELDWLPRLDPN